MQGQPGRRSILKTCAQMLQALLIERFQMKVHMEDRPVTAYTLIAVNPKLKKADPTEPYEVC